MNVYTTDKIRNVVLLGHGGVGKTTIAEAMAYLSGLTSRMGTVSDGNTISDYDKEEIKRKFSISTSVIPIEWNDTKINILDTPGLFDFVGEVEEAVSAADAAVIVVDGKSGIQVGTQKAWEICDRYNIPRLICVTGMDDDNASFRQTVMDMQELYGKKIAPFHIPVRQDEKLIGYVNIITREGGRWNDRHEVEAMEVPEYSKKNLELLRETLMESVAETSEEFMDRYFSGEEFSENEIRAALRVNVLDGSIVPISFASGINARGIYTLLDDIVKYLPSPDKRQCKGINTKTNQVFDADYDFSKPKTAYIFKTIVDPFIGKYSLIKVNSGVLKTDDVMYNEERGMDDKIGKIYVMRGNKPEEVPELHAGDIGALAKLTKAVTTDTLSTKASPVLYIRTVLSQPYTCKAYQAVNKGDEDKISQALGRMMQEDLTLKNVIDSENRQSLLYGIGEQQLDVVVSKLQEKYKVSITLSKPRIAYKETIRKKADVENKYKKQSGGHGQYGHVKMTFEPSGNLEEAYEFSQTVVGGAVPKNFFPAVEKGIAEACEAGPLAAYPVVGVKANLYDGSYHPVDSSENSFKVAARMALKQGMMQAKPILLEPIALLKVVVSDAYTGDVMGDLNKRRARVNGMNAIGGDKQEVVAEIPYAELYGYGTILRSMTGGTGDFSYEFLKYQQAPKEVQDAEVERRASKVAEGEEV